jgi:hypothetical protein
MPRFLRSSAHSCCCTQKWCNGAGIFGYLLLGDAVTTDVLADLGSKHGSIGIDVALARYGVAVKVACSYAMLCHVTKVALKDLAIGYERRLTWPQHIAATAAFVAVTMLAAMLFAKELQVRPSQE